MIQRLALLVGGIGAAAVLAVSVVLAAGQPAPTLLGGGIDAAGSPEPDVLIKTLVDTVYVVPDSNGQDAQQTSVRTDDGWGDRPGAERFESDEHDDHGEREHDGDRSHADDHHGHEDDD